MEDYEDLKNGLTNANIEAPALYMSNYDGARDVTGFNIEYGTGYYFGGKKVTETMEYWACKKDGSVDALVHFDRKGGMCFRQILPIDPGEYPARLVQPLRPNIKK